MRKLKLKAVTVLFFGTFFFLPVQNFAAPSTPSLPMYQLYNPISKKDLYTENIIERTSLLNKGWFDQGIAWYFDKNKILLFTGNGKAKVQSGNHLSNLVGSVQTNLDDNYISHRGNTQEAPENSLPAFQQANGFGVEADIQLTADHQWVVMHDSTLDRMTDGTGAINNFTLAQLASYRINSGTKCDEYLHEQLKIPTLEEYLQILQAKKMTAFIEIKDETAMQIDLENIFSLLAKYDFTSDRAKIISSDYPTLIRMRNSNPNYTYLYIVTDITDETISRARKLGNYPGIDSSYKKIDNQKVHLARQAGLEIGAWTVPENKFSAMRDFAISYITTNQAT